MASLRSSVTAMTARLVDFADTDPLTGLLNRRGLTARVAVMLDQACSSGVSLQACLVDIDHFKSVDDDFGPAIGDDVLVEVAATLHAVAGPDAVVARLGGEEFPVLGLVPSMGGVEAPLCVVDAVTTSADRALYAAKSYGRDQAAYVLAEPLPWARAVRKDSLSFE